MSSDETVTRDVIVNLSAGLHLRPISRIARLAVNSTAELTVRKGNTRADARSPLDLMALAAARGEQLTLEARGAGAAELVDAVAACLEAEAES